MDLVKIYTHQSTEDSMKAVAFIDSEKTKSTIWPAMFPDFDFDTPPRNSLMFRGGCHIPSTRDETRGKMREKCGDVRCLAHCKWKETGMVIFTGVGNPPLRPGFHSGMRRTALTTARSSEASRGLRTSMSEIVPSVLTMKATSI